MTNTNKKLSFILGCTVLISLLLGIGVMGENSLSGEEILKKVDEQQEVITRGSLASILTFETKHPDGTTSSYKFGTLAKKKPGEPDETLIYYLEPESVRGSIFLSKETEEGDTEMWLLLAAFPQPKKLPSAQKQSSFAGSTLTFQEIGDRNMSERYDSEVVEETEVEIDGEMVPAYLLDLEAEEGVETRYPKGKVWVGKENWIILKSNDYNSDGKLERVLEVKELGTFEDKRVMKKLYSENILDGSSTTITFENRERPEETIPSSVFDPENLTEFEPDRWGISE